jgi:thiol-disulfide isomerase/thioredoxin
VLERFLVVLLIGAAVIAGWRLVGIWQAHRLRQLSQSPVLPELVPLLTPGRPAVLSFSTPGCRECRALQWPALEKLATRLPEQVAIAHLSVPDHPALVEHFGILTVPATVVLDPQGTVRHINLRYTDADRLQAQLQEVAVPAIAA